MGRMVAPNPGRNPLDGCGREAKFVGNGYITGALVRLYKLATYIFCSS